MKDERFASLTHPLRQRVLLALLDREIPLRVPDELGKHGEDLPALALLLHHVHLPMLVRAEYVRWTPGEKTVTKGSRFEDVAPLLSFVSDD